MKLRAAIPAAVLMSAQLIVTGCQPTTGAPTTGAPTTQQVVSTTQFAQTAEDLVVAGLELSGVIKTKNDVKANLLQAAVNAATAKYEADLNAQFSQAQALLDAGNAGVTAYIQAQAAGAAVTKP